MGEARAAAQSEASLNALRRRAELILEQEEHLDNKGNNLIGRFKQRLWACLCSWRGIRASEEAEQEDSFRGSAKETRDTRWLHVLVPDELDLEGKGL